MRKTVELIEKYTERLWDYGHSPYSEDVFKEILENLLNDALSFDKNVYETFCFLLNNFKYYSKQDVQNHLVSLYNQLINDIDEDDVVCFSHIKSEDELINSSTDYVFNFRYLNDIEKSFFKKDLNSISTEEWDQIKSIILVDDCSGSGTTFNTFIDSLQKDLTNKTFYYLVIQKMNHSQNIFDDIMNKHTNLSIKCISIDTSQKIFDDDRIKANKHAFIKFSTLRKTQPALGYKDSEAIFAFYNNSPNNTLGVFHCTSEKNKPIFPRKTKKMQRTLNKLKTGKAMRENALSQNSYSHPEI